MPENLKPRQSAVRILARVFDEQQTLDAAVAAESDFNGYADSDRHFIRLLVLTTLRRLGQIDGVIAQVMKKPLSRKQRTVQYILRLSVAQSLFLKTPDYAVTHTAVSLTRKFHFDGLVGLVNAVLRQVMRIKEPLVNLKNPAINFPDWLYRSWEQVYGSEQAKKISAAFLEEPTLDISVRDNSADWAKRWNGQVLTTGSLRVATTTPETLDGFKTGGCWVQNAAASVPAQLFTALDGLKVADLCAAPGGKTAQLACRGAIVTAFDISEKRLNRLRENMSRLGLSVQTIASDVLMLETDKLFDAVLLDAPCSATGTIRRHPELKYQRTPADIQRLAALQKQMLEKAIALTKSGGEIVFSTCSLQPEEGDEVVRSVLGQVQVVRPIDERWQAFITPFGSLRFLPFNGYDGFYACLLRKN